MIVLHDEKIWNFDVPMSIQDGDMKNNYLQIVNNMIEYLNTGGSGIGIYRELTPVLGIGRVCLGRSS